MTSQTALTLLGILGYYYHLLLRRTVAGSNQLFELAPAMVSQHMHAHAAAFKAPLVAYDRL